MNHQSTGLLPRERKLYPMTFMPWDALSLNLPLLSSIPTGRKIKSELSIISEPRLEEIQVSPRTTHFVQTNL